MAVQKLSQIKPAMNPPVTTDQLVGVIGGTTDNLISVSQLKTAFGIARGLRYGPTWPANYPNAPTIALQGPGGNSPVNSLAVPNIPYTGQPVSLATSVAASSGNVLTFSGTGPRGITTNVMPGNPVIHSVPTPAISVGTTVIAVTPTTITLSNNLIGTVASGDSINIGQPVVSFLGLLPVFKTQSGSNYFTNGANGNWSSETFAIEFDYFGADMDVVFRAVGTTANFWVFVDGQPTTTAPFSEASLTAGSLYRLRITFNNVSDSVARLRRLRVWMSAADFGGIDTGATDTVSIVAQNYIKMAFYGDSWVEGALGAAPHQTIPVVAAQMLNAFPFNCGQVGTGYTASGGGAPKGAFTDSARLSTLGQTAADVVVVLGSVNDNSSNQSAVQAAAAAVFSSIRSSLPNAQIFAFGVQPNPASLGAPATYRPINAGVAAAAAAANIHFIDLLNNDWITGTGNTSALAGNGNADVMIGSDGINPQPGNGTEYFGRRMAAVIAPSV
jgi:hypothetical protein